MIGGLIKGFEKVGYVCVRFWLFIGERVGVFWVPCEMCAIVMMIGGFFGGEGGTGGKGVFVRPDRRRRRKRRGRGG